MKQKDAIISIKGIGEKTALLFEKLEIRTVEQLLTHYPRRYEVFEPPLFISALKEGMSAAIEASLFTNLEVKSYGKLQVLSCQVRDKSGVFTLTWFNQLYLKKILKCGYRYIFHGKVTRKGTRLVMEQISVYKREDYRILLDKLHPVYSLTEGLTNHTVSKALKEVFLTLEADEDFLPNRLKKKYSFPNRFLALQQIHFPEKKEQLIEARKRLIFDEFFLFLLALKENQEKKKVRKNGFCIQRQEDCDKLLSSLPFSLTNAQKKVWEELQKDMMGEKLMSRLIQGDVGSGKTILAILALCLVAWNGYQGCMMVPTEVLAKQHYDLLQELLEPFSLKVQLLVGSMTAAEKKKAYEAILTKKADLIIGTHAVIQEQVVFSNLALVVTDEQHRFGVKQRDALSKKGDFPHVLVMSATPIPRTLAIILYGDFDLSVVGELPKGRIKIKNCVVDTTYRNTAYEFLKKQVKRGHQVYIICPMVEESEHMEAENVMEYTEKLKEHWKQEEIVVRYLHGKMKPKEKNEVMDSFIKGETKVLVSTTVIEVGVNVKNATVMMVENAERFGLAQLHQLRGRVGRGEAESYCILVCGQAGKESRARLELLNQSNDGFYIAKEDLKQRGPGDFFGVRQSGIMEFKIGDVFQDAKLLEQAKEAVDSLTEAEQRNLLDHLSFLENEILP